MAKKTTNKHNKASILENDPRANMYQGKDRELTNEDEGTEVTEDTDVTAKTEATPEVEGFMDKNNMSAVPNKEEIPTEKREGHDYKKRYDDLKTYYDQKLSEWKQEKETLEAQSKVAEKQVQYSPPKKGKGMTIKKDMMILKHITIRNCLNGSKKRKLWKHKVKLLKNKYNILPLRLMKI